MANYGNSGFRISDAITVGTSDQFPTHFAFLGKGGWRSAATLNNLTDTSNLRVEEGCAGYVYADGSNNGLYIYLGTSWVPTPIGGTFTLSIASASALGGVRIPSTGPITINGSGDISVRTATTGQTGIVQPDGTTIGINNGTISLIGGTNLAVYNNSGTLTGTYSKLQFKGDLASVTTTALGGSTDTNVVTIDPPKIVYSTSDWTKKEIEFAASGNLTITPTATTDRIKLTIGLTGSGTLKQHLYELSDVNGGAGGTGWLPSNGQVLKYVGGTWTAATHNTGIQLTDLGISNTTSGFPLTYNNTNGQFSLAASADGQAGYLTAADRGTLFGKATWPPNPGSDIPNYYLAPVSGTTPTWVTFKDSYLNEYGKSLRVLCVASGSIAKGDIVSITTTSNSAGKPTVIKSSTSNVNIVGIAAEAKTNGQDIWIITKGLLSGVDTTSGINAIGPIYATLTSSTALISPNYTLSTTPSYNAILVGHCVYNNASGYILVDIQQLGGLATYSTTLSANTAVSINLSEYASAAITYASTHAITSLTFTGGKIGERYPIRILQQATWNASNTFTIAANWVSGNAYTAGTRVRFEDSTDNTVAYYICINNVTSTTSPKADTTNWAKYITLPFGRDIALSPYNRAEDVLMLNVTSTITVGTTVYPRIVIDTLYNV